MNIDYMCRFEKDDFVDLAHKRAGNRSRSMKAEEIELGYYYKGLVHSSLEFNEKA